MIRNILRILAGSGFEARNLSLRVLLRSFVCQKVFGVNRLVPWPVHPTSKVLCPKKIDRGTRYPGLSMGCHIDGRNGIKFGKNVWIGPRVSIISMNHDPDDYFNYLESSPIKIGDNCWLGANAVVLPGVELGEHTIVAAGGVVTRSFPEGNQVLAGIPAQVVKHLDCYKGKK
ncbi:acyltransferase [Idiomarina abyssalis]|uniref:acyltransferase n=1 Tax=Idiomarina abyssalis TaxID=86102 RepID=UPI002300FCEF|nr:acyltransferase [Idiomarina abyssalis]MDA6067155.1 acyltransferase [Idiomarina abyssalis]